VSVDFAEPTADEVRARALDWLRDHLPAGWIEAGDDAALAEARGALDVDDWFVRLGESGYATPTWPAEYGAGLSLTPLQARQVGEALDRYRVPRPWNILGIGMGGPTVIEWGSEEQKHRHLRGIATNQDIWCQLFSEPGAGSDVAGLGTSAVRDGDEWVVNGQKVWTTMGHVAKYGMLVARTDPDQPKHRRLTYFVLDMHAPGVEVRPLVQITGDAEFNEVFFTDVRVPDSARLGPVGEGWRVALTTLMNERVSLSGAGSAGGETVGGRSGAQVIARHRPVTDLRVRQGLAQAWIDGRLIRLDNQRAADKRRSGGEVGPEGSITKLQQAVFNQRLQKLAVDLEGPYGAAWKVRASNVRVRRRSTPRRATSTSTSHAVSCARRRTRSKAGLPTSCATSSASAFSGFPRTRRLARSAVEGRAALDARQFRHRVPVRGRLPVRR
jgi:alkylation response protein AidB-like acyl-CoA dehydrogenase